MIKLAPHEAAAMFDEDPTSIFFTIPDFLRLFDMELDELRKDLIAGKITASASPTPHGYAEIAISGLEVVRWMVETGREIPRRDN